MSEGDEAVALTTEEIDARLAGIDLGGRRHARVDHPRGHVAER